MAARILAAHDRIRDHGLKYCFPFSHYLTSTAMVMIGLMTRVPALKRRHRAAVVAATRSLNTYCHLIWVSGKMMRWVCKLTSLVQRTMGEDGEPEEREGYREGTQQQQLTPLSDQGFVTGYPPQHHHHHHHQQQNQMVTSGVPYQHKMDPDGAAPWMMAAGMQPVELPEWVMSDFGFETIITGEGVDRGPPSRMMSAASTTIPAQDDGGGMLLRASNADMDELMFGAGPNGMFNLDVDVDQAGVNLFQRPRGR